MRQVLEERTRHPTRQTQFLGFVIAADHRSSRIGRGWVDSSRVWSVGSDPGLAGHPYFPMKINISKSAKVSQEDLVAVLLTLIQNLDVFAWSSYEVPWVDPEFITHKLNMDPLFPSKKLKPRRSTKQHVEAVKEKVARLK